MVAENSVVSYALPVNFVVSFAVSAAAWLWTARYGVGVEHGPYAIALRLI